MLELLAIVMVLLTFGPGLMLARALSRVPPATTSELRPTLDSGPAEPCWTEAIVSDGRYRYARSQCVHDLLMEMDARARRDDYPIPKVYCGG